MPREKEETGYASTCWYKENMGFPDFLESLDEEVDKLEGSPAVAPNRLFEFAFLSKKAEGETSYTMNVDPSSAANTTTDLTHAPGQGKETRTQPPRHEGDTSTLVTQEFKSEILQVANLLNEALSFFETSPYSALKETPVYTRLLKLCQSGEYDLLAGVSKIETNKISDNTMQHPYCATAVQQYRQLPLIYASPRNIKSSYDALQKHISELSEIDDVNTEDAAPVVKEAATDLVLGDALLGLITPLIKRLSERTIDVNEKSAYVHDSDTQVTARGYGVLLGYGKYSYSPDKKSEPQIIETLEIFDGKGRHLSVLKEHMAKKKTDKRVLKAESEFYLLHPDSDRDRDELKKLKNEGIENKHTAAHDMLIATVSPAGHAFFNGVNHAVYRAELYQPFTPQGSTRQFHSIIVKVIDVKPYSHYAWLDSTIRKLAENSPMPGAWREFSETGDTDIYTSPIDRNRPFSSQPQRGAVPYMSMPNVGDGLEGNDNSITKGHAGDVEYAEKDNQKVRDRYRQILKEEAFGTDLRRYAVKRLRELGDRYCL